MFASKTNIDDKIPGKFHVSPSAQGFLEKAFKLTPTTFLNRLEHYTVHEVDGEHNNFVYSLLTTYLNGRGT